MVRRLPPLNALRAFEAAARHLSFTKAADELNVTQAAVSHQVKALEERLGMPLFKRGNRSLLLTDAGQAYLPALREAFDGIAQATDRLRITSGEGPLKVSALNSLAAKWLMPRLPKFRSLHPEVDVLIHTSDQLVDFAHDGIDVGIRYGGGSYGGLISDFLMSDVCFPVCSPKLLADGQLPLEKPADLARHTLLNDDAPNVRGMPDWRMWLRAAGVKNIDPSHGLAYSDSAMLVQAAVEGQGVALARLSIAELDLAAGRLVKPFDLEIPTQHSYYLVFPPAHLEVPKVKAFRAWILEEAHRRPVGSGAEPG
jgi:LysR family glycine cleavage system transcriptional activator